MNTCCTITPTLACLRGASRTVRFWWGTSYEMTAPSFSKMCKRLIRAPTPAKSASRVRAGCLKSPWNCSCSQRSLKVWGQLLKEGPEGGDRWPVEEGGELINRQPLGYATYFPSVSSNYQFEPTPPSQSPWEACLVLSVTSA